jgi:hypothetical protein
MALCIADLDETAKGFAIGTVLPQAVLRPGTLTMCLWSMTAMGSRCTSNTMSPKPRGLRI